MKTVVDRFLHYLTFDTHSSPTSTSTPSTPNQLVLAQELTQELTQLGLADVYCSRTGTVYAHLPGNVDAPAIGFIAHIDTSPDAPSASVKPRIVSHYDGDVILLNPEGAVLSPNDFPILKTKVGERLIVTDGSTLLGADDKAGIAEIMTMLDQLQHDATFPHGPVYVAFTPDEEIGNGVRHFERSRFPVAFAFTVDGGPVHDIEWENFHAASAKVSIQGLGIHPGAAKGKMINALTLAMQFDGLLPVNERPEYTEGYEGFYHLHELTGTVETATLHYLLRHHEDQAFRTMKQQLSRAVTYLNELHQGAWATVEIIDTYANMRAKLEHHPDIIDLVYQSIRSLGLTPSSLPIRGGTDGAMLTAQGLPCPNLGTGGYNAHSRFEFASIDEMEQSVQLLLGIIRNHAIKERKIS